MLIDKVNVKFIGGRGGDGAVRFNINRKPEGGDGGIGGSVYLKGSTNLYDLKQFRGDLKFKAGNAFQGGQSQATGKKGNDLVIEVPVGTWVFEGDILRTKIDEPGKEYLVAKGGQGGKGNFAFRTGGKYERDKYTKGEAGYEADVFLQLRLEADVIFIGLPNAGKSSLLNALTNAKSKVASYAFTTLNPSLGVTRSGITLMDLPGLIEGTAEGKGLGTKFLQHAEQANLVLHLISLESDDPERDYKVIRKEIEQMSPTISSLKEIIVLSKVDLVTEEKKNEMIKKFKKYGEVLTVSSFRKEELDRFETELNKAIASSDNDTESE